MKERHINNLDLAKLMNSVVETYTKIENKYHMKERHINNLELAKLMNSVVE